MKQKIAMNSNKDVEKHSFKCGRQKRFLIPSILLLLLEKPSHGYELMEKYPEFGFTDTGPDAGAIYRTLKSLKSDGFVESKWNTGNTGAAKKIYSITGKGKILLKNWAKEMNEKKNSIVVFLERYKKSNKALAETGKKLF
ncbi:MAG: helix-turn-helix transcriptional regulator [Actinomycetota bacterium]|jgi:poly-beta-hydroxybutyrate-responsive repressor|nr:helix-turn-helix transcriptional regulator [Actinomycetota bacterium]